MLYQRVGAVLRNVLTCRTVYKRGGSYKFLIAIMKKVSKDSDSHHIRSIKIYFLHKEGAKYLP